MLEEAINSALNQIDFIDYEVIVVDNDPDSDTETEKLLNSYNNPKLLYYKNEKSLGAAGNWNRCLGLARGKWYTMLHDDDLLSDNFLKEMLKVLNKNPKISLLIPGHAHMDERNISHKNNFYWIKLKLKKKIVSLERKLFFKKYPVYYVLKSVENTKISGELTSKKGS